MPEHLTGGLFLHVEQVHFTAQLAVVALGGLFHHDFPRLQILAVLEGHAIDALQHRAGVVAQPICAGNVGQLERIGGNLTGMLQVRTAAKILPVAMPVHADVFAFGNAVQQLDLERLACVFVMFYRAGTIPDFGFHGFAGVDDLFHPRFDLAQIFRGERFCAVEIIEPALIAHRPDGDLYVGPDFLNGTGHDMRQIVTDQFQCCVIILHGVDGDLGVFIDRPLQIPVLSVHRGTDGFFAQRGRNALGHFGRGDPSRKAARIAIGESKGDVCHILASSSVWRPRNARLRVICWRPF